ncbi:uncharacterized protein [Onthophagus taurus]|uniref:uncharacterized protein n=1 Tax=Onthophagus taurus TaxID=166361 RepID=UPI0039BE774E
MVKDQDLFAFGKNYDNINFEGPLDWFFQLTPIEHVWKYQPSYLLVHFLFIFGGLITLLHAFIRGGRLPYLWLATVLHGLVVELICYFLPDVDNFWHSQTPIMFIGRRLPLHIIFLYPCFLYQSTVAVSKLKLPKWSEPFAVGLGVVLIDIVYDIVCVNFGHWTWHDTDPSIEDRFYWVPWNSFYFHATFAASFSIWFQLTKKIIGNSNDKWASNGFIKEMICVLITSLLGVPGGVLMFIPIYHPLHDIHKIHSEVTFMFLFSIFLLLTWLGDRSARGKESPKETQKTHWSSWLLIFHLILHYATFLGMCLYFKPGNDISIGLKEPIGPCDEFSPVHTPFGMVLQKRKYLCPTNYDEKYFDWSCLPNKQPPPNGSIWYTSCIVQPKNMLEITLIAACLSVIALVVFINLHLNSFGDGVFERIKGLTKTTLKKKNK